VLTKLMDLLAGVQTPPATESTIGAPFARRDVAVVALLIEAAQIDRKDNPEENAAVERIVRERFGLDAVKAGELLATARSLLDAALEDWIFAAAVRDGFDDGERAEILGLLWEVVLADGKLARFERSLLHRLTQQLRIKKAAAATVRAQALARLGRDGVERAK
jgi:uncharacterized tellurite resistance protein B-like protein